MTDETIITVESALAGIFPMKLIFNIGPKAEGVTHEITLESLPPASIAKLVEHGAKQMIGDAKASLNDDESAAREALDRVAQKLRDADFSRASGERGPTDSVEVLMGQIAREEFASLLSAAKASDNADVKAAANAMTKEAKAKAIAALIERDGKRLRAEAQRRIDSRKALAQGVINKSGADVLAALGFAPADDETTED